MISSDKSHFLRQCRAIPTYRDCFGCEATLQDVVVLIEKYPLSEWLSFLSRIQNILASLKMHEAEKVHRLICGTVGPTVRKRLRELGFLDQPRALYYERQISTLQQLAVLHAPETGSAKLGTEEGLDALSMALLMTMDIMVADRSMSGVIESLIQDQIRMSTTPWWMYAARAFQFYELDQNEKSQVISEYLQLFQRSTHVSAVECILGGLAMILQEERRSPDEIANAWYPVVCLDQHKNPEEAEVLAAYETVRKKPLAELRALIRKWEWDKEQEEVRPARDWNLIALSQAPICDLDAMGAFVLNHTAVGRSLFDSVRHAILTAALDRLLPEPYTNEQAIGKLYGEIFESYVFSVFKHACPERVWRIPRNDREKRADFLIWSPNSVILVEVKGIHFVGKQHASFLSIEARRKELEEIDVRRAINQLELTVRALRAGEVRAPFMPSYDWKITPIIPVIVTEEQMPQVPGCWDALYAPFCRGLDELASAGRLAKLRLLTIRDVEGIPDLQAPYDLATMLCRWGANQRLAELTWGSFLEAQNINLPYTFILERFREAMKSLARRLRISSGSELG